MTTQTILDLVVILLLIPTIIYAVILNRRLVALRRSRDELARIVASFNDATLRAEAGIPKLKKATTEANQTLKERVDKAQTLRDDLAFMVQRAEELASRLEAGVRAARQDGIPVNAASAAAPLVAPSPAAPVRGFAAEPPPRTLAATSLAAATLANGPGQGLSETAAELRSAIGAARAEGRGPAPQAGRGRRMGAERAQTAEEIALEEERSEAERELLKALQAAR
jgi:hypothetical protein